MKIMKTLYYYQLAETVEGPSELEDLLRDVQEGIVNQDLMVSRGGDDPWVPLRVAKLREISNGGMKGEKKDQPDHSRSKTEAKKDTPGSMKKNPASTGLESGFNLIAIFMIVVGAITMLAALVSLQEEGVYGLIERFSLSVGMIVSGMLFLALSKGLFYLRSILAEVKK